MYSMQPYITGLFSVTLDWQDGATIAGLILAVAGFVVAYMQWRKAKSAKEAENDLRRTLHRQRAAQFFNDMARDASVLSARVRERDWHQTAEIATRLGGSIANASGFCGTLMSPKEHDTLELAANGLKALIDDMPVGEGDVDDPTVKGMMSQCIVIVYGVQQIAGRMKYLDELEGLECDDNVAGNLEGRSQAIGIGEQSYTANAGA